MKEQLWFKCERVDCDPTPFAVKISDLGEYEDVVVLCDCGTPCTPTDPPSYEAGFSRRAITEYETIRLEGTCDMLDRKCVARQAAIHGMGLLNAIALRGKDYALLLQNYSVLMRHYGLQS